MIANNIFFTDDLNKEKLNKASGLNMINETHVLIDTNTFKKIETLLSHLLDNYKPSEFDKIKQYSDLIYKILG